LEEDTYTLYLGYLFVLTFSELAIPLY